MKNVFIFNNSFRKSILSVGLFFLATYFISICFANNLLVPYNINYDSLNDDSILPDTIPAEDTVKVKAVYEVTNIDTSFNDGLDKIIYLSEDTAVYSAQASDTTITYLIGEKADYVKIISSDDTTTILTDTTLITFVKPVDTTAYYFATDTAAYYIPKNDTVAFRLIKADTVNTVNIDGEEKMDLTIFDVSDNIRIKLGHSPLQVNYSLFGVHTPGIFNPNHLNEIEDPNYYEGWQALADLKPSSLRFPGGADSRWNHPVDYDNNWDGIINHTPGNPDCVKGIGIDIDEVIRFYDVTEDEVDGLGVPLPTADPHNNIQVDAAFLATIFNDMETDGPDPGTDKFDCDECYLWMNYIDYKNNFEEIYRKWSTQNDLPADEKYIDQFIHLVHQIENTYDVATPDHPADPDYKVDVIVDLSIPSMSATECWNEVEYLRSHDINVVGVEMGNEVYYGWGIDMMGWSEGDDGFNDYYRYINGDDANGLALDEYSVDYQDWKVDYYEYVFGPPTGVLADYTDEIKADKTCIDHNYIAKFKENPLLNYKIGIPAENLNKWPEDALTGEADGHRKVDPWNLPLGGRYTDKFNVDLYIFDAVVLHPYYESNTGGWEHIALDNMCDAYPSNGVIEFGPTDCSVGSCANLFEGRWRYDIYDPRLQNTFDGMMGFEVPHFDYTVSPPYPLVVGPAPGNLNDWLRKRYKKFYLDQDANLHFSETGDSKKDLWETEKNLKDGDDIRTMIFDNTFVHGYLTMDWFLKDLTKINFDDAHFRTGFFTYSHYHSYAGGGWAEFLVQSDCDDKNSPTYLPVDASAPFFDKRTTYYSYFLLSRIVKEKLQYLPADHTLPTPVITKGINQTPYTFIDPAHKYIYVFYSNVYPTNKNIILDPGSIIGLFPGATSVSFGNAHFYKIEVTQPYMCSGKNYMFETGNGLNSCYDCTTNPHPFDIQGITEDDNIPECMGDLPPNAECVTVHGYSYGYFKMAINVKYPHDGSSGHLREAVLSNSDIVLYPNPAFEYFRIQITDNDQSSDAEKYKITITDLTGKFISSNIIVQSDRVDIAELPVGLYQVIIQLSNEQTITKPLIKMQ